VPQDRSLDALLRDVRDARWILVLAVVVGALAGVLATLLQTERYLAQGSVVVSPARFLDPNGTDALPALTDTVVELSSREAVLRPTGSAYVAAAPDAGARLRRSREATLDWLQQSARARRVGTSSVIEMSGTASTARDAEDLSRAFVSSLTAFVRRARTGEPSPSTDGPVGVGLVTLGSGELVGQVSPTPARNLFAGISAGLIVGVVLAVALGPRRRRRGAAQTAADLGVPSLGAFRPGGQRQGAGLLATHNLLEALSASRGTLAVVLTGSTSSERIGEVAEAVVRSLDIAGNRALLIDGDRDRSAVSRRLGTAERPGLLDGVANGTDVSRKVITVHPPAMAGEAPVHVLPAGAPPVFGTALDARGLQPALDRLRQQFNFLIISGPALEHDAGQLAILVSVADCWLLVTDADVIAADLADARALMEHSPTPMMGILAVDGSASSNQHPAVA
jgi:Mrp family chromosome partitioning ATPase